MQVAGDERGEAVLEPFAPLVRERQVFGTAHTRSAPNDAGARADGARADVTARGLAAVPMEHSTTMPAVRLRNEETIRDSPRIDCCRAAVGSQTFTATQRAEAYRCLLRRPGSAYILDIVYQMSAMLGELE